MENSISAVIITKNEEKNIARCLQSLKWCNELIVIDDYSSDETAKIAKKFKAKVFKRKLNGNFADQRNFGISKTKGKWILFIDADEEVSTFLRDEIKEKVNGKHVGFLIPRRDIIFGREAKHGEIGSTRLLRLAKKGNGKWKRKVHEVWKVKGKVGIIHYSILHFPHQTIKDFLSKVNFYSTIHAEEGLKEGKNASIFNIFIYPIGKFVVFYFFKLGFLDGLPGFIISIMMSFHSFLAWSKLWFLSKHKRQYI